MKTKRIILAAVVFVLLIGAAVAATLGLGNKQPAQNGSAAAAAGSGSAVVTHTDETPAVRPQGPTVYVDGKEMSVGSQLEGKTVMVSADVLADMLEAEEYHYDIETGKLELHWKDNRISMTIGSRKAKANGASVKIKAPYIDENGEPRVPALAVAKALGAGTMKLDGAWYITRFAGMSSIPQGYHVPVLMYHAVGDDLFGGAELFVSESNLEAQLKYLVDNGYTTITFEDLPRINEIEKPVMLTFDDGYDNNYELLYPLLQKYNCKATIFVITHTFTKGYDSKGMHKMTKKQVRELSDSGLVSIQSHTVMHYQLGTLSDSEQEAQFRQSRRDILRVTGKQPFVMCFPNGSYNSKTTELVDKYYQYGIKINGGTYNTSDDPNLVSRHYISRYTDLDTFASYIG